MLLSHPKLPTSLIVTIWSLRSVPIALSVLMFIFNSGSIRAPQATVHFWFDTLAIAGIVGILAAWHHRQRLSWNAGFVIYLYIFLVLILRNPFNILSGSIGQLGGIDWRSFWTSLAVGGGVLLLGTCLEIVIFYLRQFKMWAWWLALIVSIGYVATILFFFSGTLGIWSLLDPDTKKSFRERLRQG
jgi:hypothetical protein